MINLLEYLCKYLNLEALLFLDEIFYIQLLELVCPKHCNLILKLLEIDFLIFHNIALIFVHILLN